MQVWANETGGTRRDAPLPQRVRAGHAPRHPVRRGGGDLPLRTRARRAPRRCSKTAVSAATSSTSTTSRPRTSRAIEWTADAAPCDRARVQRRIRDGLDDPRCRAAARRERTADPSPVVTGRVPRRRRAPHHRVIRSRPRRARLGRRQWTSPTACANSRSRRCAPDLRRTTPRGSRGALGRIRSKRQPPGHVADRHLALMRDGDPSHDRESEPCAARAQRLAEHLGVRVRRAGARSAPARVEHAMQVVFVDAAAGVDDRDRCASVDDRCRDRDRRPGRGVLDRIQEQVRDRPRQLARVGVHDRARGRGRLRSGCRDPATSGADLPRCRRSRRTARRPAVTSRSVPESILDSSNRSSTIADSRVTCSRIWRWYRCGSRRQLVLQRLGHRHDAGERRAQVVRDPRDELAARLLDAMLALARLGELRAGGDELVGEGAELGAGLRADGIHSLSGADAARRARERPGVAHHDDAEACHQRERDGARDHGDVDARPSGRGPR